MKTLQKMRVKSVYLFKTQVIIVVETPINYSFDKSVTHQRTHIFKFYWRLHYAKHSHVRKFVIAAQRLNSLFGKYLHYFKQKIASVLYKRRAVLMRHKVGFLQQNV